MTRFDPWHYVPVLARKAGARESEIIDAFLAAQHQKDPLFLRKRHSQIRRLNVDLLMYLLIDCGQLDLVLRRLEFLQDFVDQIQSPLGAAVP